MKIGTRSSAMALAQTRAIVARLQASAPGCNPEIVQFRPVGDRDLASRLDTHGGKGGAFVAEIRAAIRQGALDCAMHSLKDVPGDEETPGLVLGAHMRREAVEDVLVLKAGRSFSEFESARGRGFRIGTNSVRRAAYLRRLYPECEVIHFRGAADSRIRKLDEGRPQKLPEGGETGLADGLAMARSGLERVGLAHRIAAVMPVDRMLPAVGQGTVVVECAAGDWRLRGLLSLIDDAEARACALAEREALWILNGHCNSPIAGLARIEGADIELRAAVLSLDGGRIVEAHARGPADRPRELGRAVGFALLEKGARALIAEARF
jgi:hydroxymethylbilane synthase